MKRKNFSGFQKRLHQQPICLHHHLRIRCLHGNNQILVVAINANTNELHGRFHHAFRGVSVTTKNSIGERTVIGSNTHRRSVFFTNFNKRNKTLTNAIQFSQIRFVGINNLFKFLFIGVIARIHTNLLYNASRYFRGIRSEVNICNQRSVIAQLVKLFANVSQILCFIFTGSGNSHQLTTRFNHTNAFSNGCFSIHRICSGHRLHTNRRIAPHG